MYRTRIEHATDCVRGPEGAYIYPHSQSLTLSRTLPPPPPSARLTCPEVRAARWPARCSSASSGGQASAAPRRGRRRRPPTPAAPPLCACAPGPGNAEPVSPAGGRESPKFSGGLINTRGRYCSGTTMVQPDAERGLVGRLRAGARAVGGRRMRPVAGAMGCAGFCCAAAGLGGGRRAVCR